MATSTNLSILQTWRKWSNRLALGTKVILTLFLVTSFSSLKLFAQDPGKGGTRVNFEIDADFKSGFIPTFWNSSTYPNSYTPDVTTFGDDWSGLHPVLKQKSVTIGSVTQVISDTGRSADGRSIWHVDGNWGGGSAVAELVSFAGNSNKNGDNIAAGQHPYSLQVGGSGPQKNDITNTYLFSRQVLGSDNKTHTWLFFGAETRATNGNSYLDFEYNQAGVTIVNNAQLVGNGPVNGRSVGDFLLVINYTGGGNRPIIGVRKWLVSGTWSAELPVTSTQFITTNSDFVDPVAPNKAFASDGSYANTVMPLQFMEGGVDITELNIAELDLCTANATVTVKSRSSSSYTAELKDLDVINFSLLPPAGLEDLTAQNKCPTQDATFSTTASGDGASAANIGWYKVTLNSSNQEVETAITDDNTKYDIVTSGLTSTLTIHNVASADAGTYRAKLSNAACVTPQKDGALTVKTAPDQKDGVIQPITCTDRGFKLKIATPQSGVTYTVTQPCNTAYSSTGTSQTDGSLLFADLKFAAGYKIIASKDNCVADPVICGGTTCSDICATTLRVNNVQTQEITLDAPTAKPSVVAAPNPFNDRIKFSLKSAVSGKGSLELYNMLGQRVKTVFQGYVEAGQVQNIEYAVPGAQRSNLIYVFRVGSESTSGKLIGLKQ